VVRQVRGSGGQKSPSGVQGRSPAEYGAPGGVWGRSPPKKLKHFVTDRPTLNSEANCKKKLGK